MDDDRLKRRAKDSAAGDAGLYEVLQRQDAPFVTNAADEFT